MKVYTYNMADGRFLSTKLPVNATNVIVYDKSNVLDVSAIYSNAIEDNWVAQVVMFFWDYPQRTEILRID